MINQIKEQRIIITLLKLLLRAILLFLLIYIINQQFPNKKKIKIGILSLPLSNYYKKQIFKKKLHQFQFSRRFKKTLFTKINQLQQSQLISQIKKNLHKFGFIPTSYAQFLKASGTKNLKSRFLWKTL